MLCAEPDGTAAEENQKAKKAEDNVVSGGMLNTQDDVITDGSAAADSLTDTESGETVTDSVKQSLMLRRKKQLI